MEQIKKMLYEKFDELAFCLYVFLPVFMLIFSVLVSTNLYKVIFVLINVVLISISIYKNKSVLIKKDFIVLAIVLAMFLIDFFLRKNSYTMQVYYNIAKCCVLAIYYLFRVNDFKVVLKYLSFFSKIAIVMFVFDPFMGYYYTTNYMGYGYAIMLPAFISIYLYHFIEKKDCDLLFLILSFILIFVFANRTCVLCILFLIILTFKVLKNNYRNREKWFVKRKAIRSLLIVILLASSFGCNYFISHHLTNKNQIVIENKDVDKSDDKKKLDVNVNCEDDNVVESTEIKDDSSEKITTRSYSFDKYWQVLNGKFDRIFSDRFRIYKDAIKEISEHHLRNAVTFVFGLGSGYFMSVYDGVYTHFILFDLFIEYGLLGTIVGVCLIIYCLKKYMSLPRDKENYIYLFSTYCLVLAFPKLLLSSYFQKEIAFFLFIATIIFIVNNEKKAKVNGRLDMKKSVICKRCVMDDVNTDITFDEKGYCNYCTDALKKMDSVWHKNGKKELDEIIKNMKEANKNNKYDCILGLSGGVDSCYTAYILSKYKVRMLAVHIDGGWNTDISSKNVELLCKKLNIELHTIKVDADEMYDLQRAYFMAEVINQDVPQDHVFFSKLYRYALDNNIKYFVSGVNYSSESILPKSWGFNAMDGKNMKDIHKKYGKLKLKDVKPLSFFEIYIKIPHIDKLKKIEPLNYMDYNKEKAIKELHDKIGFEYYGGKHCESVFTRLYQNYILPKKYGINKTKAHYSSLIVADQMTRDEALKLLKKNEYTNNEKLLESDINAFIKNIGITRKEFDKIMNDGVIRNHRDFKNYSKVINFFVKVKHIFKKNK